MDKNLNRSGSWLPMVLLGLQMAPSVLALISEIISAFQATRALPPEETWQDLPVSPAGKAAAGRLFAGLKNGPYGESLKAPSVRKTRKREAVG